MTAYYNENDPFAAAWLRNLIGAGLIAAGDVDERSIEDVKANEVKNYTQCHFFAGIGIWSLALRGGGWSDNRPVWTGSCPCQPLSSAGEQRGHADERHLWPTFFNLIAECQPAAVFGEQVASKIGREWFAAVRSDMEGIGYACGAADLCAAGEGAPHIRQRLFFVAHPTSSRIRTGLCNRGSAGERGAESSNSISLSRMGNAESNGRRERRPEPAGQQGRSLCARASVSGQLADSHGGNASPERLQRSGQHRQQSQDGGSSLVANPRSRRGEARIYEPDERQAGNSGKYIDSSDQRIRQKSTLTRPYARTLNSVWGNADWLLCRDGKWRPVESGTFPLVNGYPERMGCLRAYGNAISPEVAIPFIEAASGCLP